jgi:AraC-like DNA-binding protein
VDRLGGWGAPVARCSTLRRASLTFCERFALDASSMQLGVEVRDDYAWLWRRRPRQVIGWLGDEEGQQYALAVMIRVARGAMGGKWLPPRIQLESATAPWIESIPGLAAREVELGRPVVAIAIPYACLDRSTSWPNGTEKGDFPALPAAACTLAGSLAQAISTLLPARHPSLEVAAEIAELSPRTLRRRLAEEGTTWRRVLDEARLDACRRLLRDPERPLAQIALDLDYSDQAHLTRAFRRWTGEWPSEYRRRQRETRAA